MEASLSTEAKMIGMRAQAIDCRCALRSFGISVLGHVTRFTSLIAYIDDYTMVEEQLNVS